MGAIIPPPPYPPPDDLPAPGTSGNVLTSNGTAWTSAAPATMTNPMTLRGQIVYASADGAPSTPAALSPGAAGTFLMSNGPGADPSYEAVTSTVTGLFSAGASFGAADSAVGYRITNGSSSPVILTCTDSTSSDTTAFLGTRSFIQSTSNVANNTATMAPTTFILPGFGAKPFFAHRFGIPSPATSQFTVISYRGGAFLAANAAGATATEDTQSVGVSYLTGDATWYAYCRAAGASVRTALSAAPVANTIYLVTVDATLYPASITVTLRDITAGTLVGSVTFSSGLPTSTTGGALLTYLQTTSANVRSIAHAGSFITQALT